MSQSSVPNVLVVGVSRADIRKSVPARALTVLQDGNATLDNILKSITSCSVVHLACHAHQHLLDPLSSAFLVHGEKLLLSKIVEASSKKAELAILSAKGDENTPDEAIHLAGGMLFAGFPTVIATMWAIDDYDAPEVTKAIYEATFDNLRFYPTRAASALHRIAGSMRERGVEFARWVPFVYLGI